MRLCVGYWVVRKHVMFALTSQVPIVLLHHFFPLLLRTRQIQSTGFSLHICWKNLLNEIKKGIDENADRLA